MQLLFKSILNRRTKREYQKFRVKKSKYLLVLWEDWKKKSLSSPKFVKIIPSVGPTKAAFIQGNWKCQVRYQVHWSPIRFIVHCEKNFKFPFLHQNIWEQCNIMWCFKALMVLGCLSINYTRSSSVWVQWVRSPFEVVGASAYTFRVNFALRNFQKVNIVAKKNYLYMWILVPIF